MRLCTHVGHRVASLAAIFILLAGSPGAVTAAPAEDGAGGSAPGTVVLSKLIEGEVPANDPMASIWATAPAVEFPLSAQVNWEPRIFTVTVRAITVRSVHNRSRIAFFLLEYADPTEDQGDAAALEFPVGDTKPHFAHAQHLAQVDSGRVNIWHWKAADQAVADLNAQGFGTLARQAQQDVTGKGVWKDGRWRIVLSRALATEDANDAQFNPGTFLLFAMAAWDGGKGEAGAQKAVSSWYYLTPEAPREIGLTFYPALAALLVVGAEFLLLRRLRRAPTTRTTRET